MIEFDASKDISEFVKESDACEKLLREKRKRHDALRVQKNKEQKNV